MAQRQFTPVQANRTLPLVRRIVDDILLQGRALRAITEGGDGLDEAARDRIFELQHTIEGLMGELQQIGCSYKDWGFEHGLVDFPGTIDGEPVLLCWRSDEPQVGHYHGYLDGFAGRRPIPTALLEEAEG